MTPLRPPLRRLILPSVASFFALQCAYAAIVTAVFHLPLVRLLALIGAAAGYHALVFLGLQRLRREFNLEETGAVLASINLPLVLSFLRLSSVPTVVFLFLSLREIPVPTVLVPFLVVIFFTDLLDGLLARKLNQTTRIGRILDAGGDYLLILAVSILFGLFALIPWWLVGLVLGRLLLQSLGVVRLYLRRGYSAVRLTFLGKASIFSTFCLYGFELAEYLRLPVIGSPLLLPVLEKVAAAILAASIVDKIIFLRRAAAAKEAPRSAAPRRSEYAASTPRDPEPS